MLPIKVEQDVQLCSNEHETKRVPPVSKKSVGEANEFSSLLFPKKLWKWWETTSQCHFGGARVENALPSIRCL